MQYMTVIQAVLIVGPDALIQAPISQFGSWPHTHLCMRLQRTSDRWYTVPLRIRACRLQAKKDTLR